MLKAKIGPLLMLLVVVGMFVFAAALGNESGGAAGTQLAQNQNQGEPGDAGANGGQAAPPASTGANNSPPADDSSPARGDETFPAGGIDIVPPLPEDSPPEAAGNTGDSGDFVPPAQGYWIEVIIDTQKVCIYQDGDLIKEWTASTGIADKPTPKGVFKIQNRGEWFYSEKYQQGARWWVSFKDWGVYLFHSIPMDRQQQVIASEAERLGTPASHGCVRLAIENAKWIYDHIPQGTPVYIH